MGAGTGMCWYAFVCIVYIVCIVRIDRYSSVLVCIVVYWHFGMYYIYWYVLICIVCNGLY